MKILELKKLQGKLYFTAEDLAEILGIKPKSACVLCSRYVKKGIFIRLKKNFYLLEQKWNNLSREEYFKIANFLQVPSYISFMTALSFYEVTTQVQRDFYESASLKRSRTFNIKNTTFNFYKPGLTPTQVKAKLEATAEPLSGYDTNHQGKGLVRADLAVQ